MNGTCSGVLGRRYTLLLSVVTVWITHRYFVVIILLLPFSLTFSFLRPPMATVPHPLSLASVGFANRTSSISRSTLKCCAQSPSPSLGHSPSRSFLSLHFSHSLMLHPPFTYSSFSWQRPEVSRSFQEGERHSSLPLHIFRSPHSGACVPVPG